MFDVWCLVFGAFLRVGPFGALSPFAVRPSPHFKLSPITTDLRPTLSVRYETDKCFTTGGGRLRASTPLRLRCAMCRAVARGHLRNSLVKERRVARMNHSAFRVEIPPGSCWMLFVRGATGALFARWNRPKAFRH